MRLVLALLALVETLALTAVSAAGKPPYPEGQSWQTHAGLRYRLEIPQDYDPTVKYSLIVGLHGAGATAKGFATWWEPLAGEDFIVCCPKSTGAAWNKPDVEKTKRIVEHLLSILSIDPKRIHGVGFSNGGAHLGFLVMDAKLPFATACWMGSGFTGGKVPRRAKTDMAVIALVGAKDHALGAARQTAERLKGKVRWTEFHTQADLAHEIPRALVPYYYYWLTVMEGRYTPGEDAYFDWHYGLESAREVMKEERRAGFVHFYSDDDTKSPDAKHLEHVVLFDPLVRHFGRQLVPIQLQKEHDPKLLEQMGVTKTPAIAVLAPDGKVTGVFEGRVEARAVAKAFRRVARDRSLPK